MLPFYSNGKVFGCYIILTWILLSVSNFAKVQGRIRGSFSESGELRYSVNPHAKTCLEEGNGKGQFVYVIDLYSNSGVNMLRSHFVSEEFNRDYKDLVEKITIDCNGRTECNSSHSGRRIPRPTLYDSPIDYIDIFYECKPTSVDNITVFNIGLDLDSKNLKSYFTYYLVLPLENKNNTHRHCRIRGNKSYFSIKVLHVDFGLNPECHKISSDSLHQCHENMTLVSRHNEGCNYTWQPSFTHKRITCNNKDVDIDMYMSTAFVWLEIIGISELNCCGAKSNNDETCYSPTFITTNSHKNQPLLTNGNGLNTAKTSETNEISHSTTNNILVTNGKGSKMSHSTTNNILVTNGEGSNKNIVDYEMTHSTTNNILVTNGNGPNKTLDDDDIDQFDIIYKIAIPVNVVVLTFLVAIVLFVVCVCRRRESKRSSNYGVPSLRDPDIHSNNAPLGSSAIFPHASHMADYLKVIHWDDGYLEHTVVFKNQEPGIAYEEISQ